MAEKTNVQPESGDKVINLDQLKAALLRGKHDTDEHFNGITVTLPAESWNDRAQTINHESLLANSMYWYFVCGDADNFGGWSESCINADNITENGKMTFHCMATPTTDLVVNILRMEVETTDE